MSLPICQKDGKYGNKLVQKQTKQIRYEIIQFFTIQQQYTVWPLFAVWLLLDLLAGQFIISSTWVPLIVGNFIWFPWRSCLSN